jgi:hypothetical protein
MRTVVGILMVLAFVAACDGGSSANDVADTVEVVDEGQDAAETAEDGAGPDAAADADGETAEDDGAAESVAANAPCCEEGVSWNTRHRWVDPVSGHNYCNAPCHGCTAECRNDGTADEGWYAACSAPTADAGCGDLPGLIGRANCM